MNRDHKHGRSCTRACVFIMTTREQFMPNDLRFVRGLIDSSHLPLNVSRGESLQDSTVTRYLVCLMRNVRCRCWKTGERRCEKIRTTLLGQFGLVLKEGPVEDPTNVETIAGPCASPPRQHHSSAYRPCRWRGTFPARKKGHRRKILITSPPAMRQRRERILELLQGIEVLLLV
ncbi:hypothetical protein ACNKHS_02570 [Shigella flexneri]